MQLQGVKPVCACVCIVSVCETEKERGSECVLRSTAAQLDWRQCVFLSCVEVVVEFWVVGRGQIFGQIWTDNPVGAKLDAGILI